MEQRTANCLVVGVAEHRDCAFMFFSRLPSYVSPLTSHVSPLTFTHRRLILQ